jgi:tRNA modification GTPase
VFGTHLQLDDTIAALASAAGPAARGIVRISGPNALACLDGWFEPADRSRWKSIRVASCHAGFLRLAGVRSALSADVYAWPNARSYTGQPLVEIHAPGSPPLLEAVLVRTFEAGARPAHPGEFTLRAFLGGRIDLIQAEAVLGVIDARGDGGLAVALRQLAGGVSGRMLQVRSELTDLLADLEAGLDFVEEDIAFVSREQINHRIRSAQEAVDHLQRQCQSRGQSLGRRRVVLAGLPNAGKSTLFNALLARDAAIVSPIAGTTRDYLSGAIEWSGVEVELIDTAGWEGPITETADASGALAARDGLTGQAQQLGAEQRRQADMILWCIPADVSEEAEREAIHIREREAGDGRPVIVVRTKSDLVPTCSAPAGESADLFVSAKAGHGLSELVERCVQVLAVSVADESEVIGSTAARCRESLAACQEGLVRAASAVELRKGDEIVALELRECLDQLGRVLGTVYTDDLLDRIFSRFCIGK